MTHANRSVLEIKSSVANNIDLLSESDNKGLPYRSNFVSSLSIGTIILWDRRVVMDWLKKINSCNGKKWAFQEKMFSCFRVWGA